MWKPYLCTDSVNHQLSLQQAATSFWAQISSYQKAFPKTKPRPRFKVSPSAQFRTPLGKPGLQSTGPPPPASSNVHLSRRTHRNAEISDEATLKHLQPKPSQPACISLKSCPNSGGQLRAAPPAGVGQRTPTIGLKVVAAIVSDCVFSGCREWRVAVAEVFCRSLLRTNWTGCSTLSQEVGRGQSS